MSLALMFMVLAELAMEPSRTSDGELVRYSGNDEQSRTMTKASIKRAQLNRESQCDIPQLTHLNAPTQTYVKKCKLQPVV